MSWFNEILPDKIGIFKQEASFISSFDGYPGTKYASLFFMSRLILFRVLDEYISILATVKWLGNSLWLFYILRNMNELQATRNWLFL